MPLFEHPENITGVVELVEHANTITESYLGLSILIVIGIISFISTKTYSSDKAIGFSAFIVFLSALLLRFMNLITNGMFYGVVVIFTGAVIYLWFLRQQETV